MLEDALKARDGTLNDLMKCQMSQIAINACWYIIMHGVPLFATSHLLLDTA